MEKYRRVKTRIIMEWQRCSKVNNKKESQGEKVSWLFITSASFSVESIFTLLEWIRTWVCRTVKINARSKGLKVISWKIHNQCFVNWWVAKSIFAIDVPDFVPSRTKNEGKRKGKKKKRKRPRSNSIPSIIITSFYRHSSLKIG